MFLKLRDVLQEEYGNEGQPGGATLGGDFPPADAMPEIGDDPKPAEPVNFIRDLAEEDVYNRLSDVKEFPNRLSALESRLAGRFGPVMERLQGLEKERGTQAAVNLEALAPLKEYDENLYSVLEKILPDLIKVQQLDDAAMRPYLDPVHDKFQGELGESIALAFFSPEEIGEIVPDVDDNGIFAPKTDLQRSFVDWFSQQGYQTQEAMSRLGPGWVRAMKSFKEWDGSKRKERETAAAKDKERLAGGASPSSQGRRAPVNKGPQSEEEAAQMGFDEVFKERNG